MRSNRSTGFPAADAQSDFIRARRRHILTQVARALRLGRSRGALSFDEVIARRGRVSERYLGVHAVPLDSIVGSVDRTADFDYRFRPASGRMRARWERVATAQRRGEPLPPIDVYRVGDLHFVRDGHHRVSVARAMGRHSIDAHVTEVQTRG